MDNKIGLRERKKIQTKQALTESAYSLFAKQGYAKTSIEDIARTANFSPRTFFLHFESKEDLLFPDEQMVISSLDLALNERKEGVTALQTLRVWTKRIISLKEPRNSPANILRRRIIESDKTLQTRQRLYLSAVEDVLTEAIASDLNMSSDQLKPRIVASAAIAIFGMYEQQDSQELDGKGAQEYIDIAMDFLESGLSTLVKGN